MGIWAGLDKEVDDAHRVIPIAWGNGAWTLLPTHVCVTVRVYEGVFPLRGPPDDCKGMIEDAPEALLPAEVRELEQEDQNAAQSETEEAGEYEVEKIAGHQHHTDYDTEFCIRFKGFGEEEDNWRTAAQIPQLQDMIDEYIEANKKDYYEGIVTTGAVAAIMAIKDDAALYEQQSKIMRQEARQQAGDLPQYPECLNRQQYNQLEAEAQLEYREAATEASEGRRQMLVRTVGCTYQDAKVALRSGTKDLDKVVDQALYLSYMGGNAYTELTNTPNETVESYPTLTQTYQTSTPAPNSIMHRTDRTAHPGSALQNLKLADVDQHAMGVLLRSSYSVTETAATVEEVGGDRYAMLRGYTPPDPAHTTQLGQLRHGVYASIQQMHDEQPIVELTNDELLQEFLGEHCIAIVGATEVPIKEVITTHPEKAKAAIEKELHAMHELRHRLVPVDEADLTDSQKKHALQLRMAMTWKRPSPEQLEAATPEEIETETAGTLKARLVAKDLKAINKLPEEETFAGVPELQAVRLVLASTNIKKQLLSTTDFDTAYLQTPEDKRDKWIVCKRWCPYTHAWIYEYCTGNIYGKQVGAKVWKDKVHSDLTSPEFGFIEVENTHSLYYNPAKDIVLSMHVDDPLIRTNSKEGQEWMHSMLDKRFDTKGIRRLTVDSPLDYLSIRIMMHNDGKITLDNHDKIEGFLKQHGMDKCNPVSNPLTKQMLQDCAMEDTPTMDAAATERYQRIVGDGIWLVSTTHPILATSTSILAGMNCAPPEAAEKLLTHYLRYLQHVKGHCLVVNPNPTRPGIMHYSDSDWAGLYAYTGETRSRSGMLVTYNDMPISWHSKHQKCKGTAHKEDLDLFHIATASAEAELYAAADAVKACLHLRYIGQELNIALDPITTLQVDATAAIGKIQGPRGGGKMKHIDLRQGWIKQLRDQTLCKVVKIAGEENLADSFTKLLPLSSFKETEGQLMPYVLKLT